MEQITSKENFQKILDTLKEKVRTGGEKYIRTEIIKPVFLLLHAEGYYDYTTYIGYEKHDKKSGVKYFVPQKFDDKFNTEWKNDKRNRHNSPDEYYTYLFNTYSHINKETEIIIDLRNVPKKWEQKKKEQEALDFSLAEDLKYMDSPDNNISFLDQAMKEKGLL